MTAPSIRTIGAVAAACLGVPEYDVFGENREKRTVFARRVAMFVAARHHPREHTKIGRALGNRTRTVVQRSLEDIAGRLDEPVIADAVSRVGRVVDTLVQAQPDAQRTAELIRGLRAANANKHGELA